MSFIIDIFLVLLFLFLLFFARLVYLIWNIKKKQYNKQIMRIILSKIILQYKVVEMFETE